MTIEGLSQAPFNTTMMGVMRGACDLFGLAVSDAFLYGASGHAFVLNIHRELCPSGPYVWDRRPVEGLLENLGLRTAHLGFFTADSTPDERADVERRIRAAIGSGAVCYLLNMENQLILGYDDTGFITAQPWKGHDFPPAHLTYGAWHELGEEVHVSFYVLNPCSPADRCRAVVESLRYAVGIWRTPVDDSEDYATGAAAYQRWIHAVESGHGTGHGAWWNAVVWAECRMRAAQYLNEVEILLPAGNDASAAAEDYRGIAGLMERAVQAEVPAREKMAALQNALELEAECIARLETILSKL